MRRLQQIVKNTLALLVVLVASAGLGLAYVWRNQQAIFYRRQFEIERDKAILAQRYAYLIRFANDIILLADQELHLLEANERAVDAYGYAKDELLQMSLQDLHPLEERPFPEEKLRQAGDTEGLLLETSQQRQDGATFPVEISLNLLEIDGQKFYQAIIRDVTSRKQAEEALRRSEASLAEAQRIAHLGKWKLDLRQNRGIWSDETYRMFGLKPRESVLTYENFLSFIHPDDLTVVKQQVAEALKSGQYGPYDFRVVWRDGTIRYLNSRGEVHYDSEGRPLRLVGTAQDVTERKLAEEALRRSEASLAEAQRIAHLGSWEWNSTTDKIIWSEEVFRIYGLTQQSPPLSYEAFLRYLHPEDLQKVKNKVAAALKGEEPYCIDFRIIRPDGMVRILHNEAEVTFGNSGKAVSLIGIVQDITERQQAEEALRRSEESLRQLTEQLWTAQETERRRISLLLHDELGQALMLFKFQLKAIKDKLRKEKSTSANDCLDMLQYLDGLIQMVRLLSRDLNSPDILEDLGFQGAIRYLIEEVGKNFHIQAGKVSIAKIDPLFSPEALISIYRIFQESLMNIARHAYASQFSINVKKKQDHVSFMIQDNGTGFDKMSVMGQNRANPGLGIPSMEERVRSLGGSMDIQTEPGAGTRISFDLPIKVN